MIDTSAAIGVLVATLALFVWIGTRAGGERDRDRYLTARGSQQAPGLAISFFASGLGAWVLFAPPEVGTFAGLLGVVGYGVAAGLPFVAFAFLGPRIRSRLPAGVTLTDYVRMRFGRTTQAYVALISVFYMFMFVTAELTAVGGVLSLLGDVDRWVSVVAVAGATAGYTAYGGLPASLRTDRWQGWIVVALVAVGISAILIHESDPLGAAADGGLTDLTRPGLETFVVLAIAVTAANLFHQGYWQRIWSAADDRSLRRGAWIGGLASVPVVGFLAALGSLAAGRGDLEVPSLAFFALLQDLTPWVLWLVVALGIALVASSTDTLQNGLVALVSADVAGGRLPLRAARLLTVLLTVPAVVIAAQGLSVLRLFLIADLLAAATVVPVFLGLRARTRAPAVVAGSIAGLLAVVGLGWSQGGAVTDGFELLTLPGAVPDFGAFLWAAVCSSVVTSAGSWILERTGPGTRPSTSALTEEPA